VERRLNRKKKQHFQSAIIHAPSGRRSHDVAVLPEAQGKGIGKVIIKAIVDRLPTCNIIPYATPGMEGFYKKLGFGAMKTGMAVFTTPQATEKFTE
jgi:GNAT superfamily N-acetyltransferase